MYALAAIGLVLIYRGSGVVNFAHAAVGLVGSYVYYEIAVVRGLGSVLGFVLGTLTSAALGASFHLVVMRRLGAASTLARVVATLAWLSILQGLAVLRYGQFPRLVPSILPNGPFTMFGITVGEDRLWILGIVACLTLSLWFFYRFSRFGVATSAVAENPRAAAALAVSPDFIAATNWAIGSGLGAVAAIFLVPITGLGSSNITLLVIPVLAAAVVGRFSSFPLTAAAGLGIGVAQSLVVRYVEVPGWGTAVPFVLASAVLAFRGSVVAGKDMQFGQMPALGSGRLAPGKVVLVLGAVMACVWWLFPEHWLEAFLIQVAVAIVLVSLVVVTGFAGQLSLAQFTFAGLGAVGTAWLTFHHGWSFGFALFGGALLTIPVGVLLGVVGLRTRGVNLAIVTMGFAMSVPAVVFGNPGFMRRVMGRDENLSFFGIDVSVREHPQRYVTVAVVVLTGVCFAVANLRRGRAGRRLIAVRTNERAAAALGVSVVGAKLYGFVLGGVIAALGGTFLAFRRPIVGLGGFGGLQSVGAIQHVVLGGVGTIAGPLIGSSLYSDGLGQRLFVIFDVFGEGPKGTIILSIVGSLILLAMLMVNPDGLSHALIRMKETWVRTTAVRTRAQSTQSQSEAKTPPVSMPGIGGLADEGAKVSPMSLEVSDLSVWFGGNRALSELSLKVKPGEIVGLIGPNGAGKSTAIEAITGFVSPRSGSVSVGGAAVDGWTCERRARFGLSRSFQSLELFEDLTVLENIQTACDGRDHHAYLTDLVAPGRAELTATAWQAVKEFGLEGDLGEQARHISYAKRRMLAVARAVAGGQSVLLLDEPAAGLDRDQTLRLSESIRRLAVERGVAILLVDHNVDMVLRTCDRVHALDFGCTIGEGTPSQIAKNPAVVEAYLGAGPEVADVAVRT